MQMYRAKVWELSFVAMPTKILQDDNLRRGSEGGTTLRVYIQHRLLPYQRDSFGSHGDLQE